MVCERTSDHVSQQSKHPQLEHLTALPHLTPISMILNSPHLVDEIMNHATRATLVACLRVNRDIHDAAGRVLYHTVRINGNKLDGLLEGVSVKEGKPFPKSQPVDPCFKNDLLSRIRVLSVGSHRWHLCRTKNNPHKYDYTAMLDTLRRLMSGVHTVRIVLPEWQGRLGNLCRTGYSPCFFLPLLSPKVVIFRNACGRTLYDHLDYWRFERRTSIIWVLPSHTSKRGNIQLPFLRLNAPGAVEHNVLMVFHDRFERWRKNSRASTTASTRTVKITGIPFRPSSLINFFHDARTFSKQAVTTVYGLETVNVCTNPSDPAVYLHQQSFPKDHALTFDDVRQLVINNVQDKPASVSPVHIPNTAYTFKTLSEFDALNAATTRYVICDDYRF